MRSRYSAYAVGAVSYLQRTTHPRSPHRGADLAVWTDQLRAYCDALECLGLEVTDAVERGDEAEVEFFARLSLDGRDVSFRERSSFRRVDGRWYYVDKVAWTGR